MPNAPETRWSSNPLLVAIAYVVLSVAWIVFTDEIVAAMSLGPEAVTAWSIFKGMAYVLFSGYVMYRLLRRKEQEERLRREHISAVTQVNNLEAFIAGAPVAMAMFDRGMCYLEASDRWCKDYSLDRASILGKSHYEVFPDLPEAWKEAHRRGLAGEVLNADEDRFVAPTGKEHFLRWDLRPWRKTDQSIGGIIICTEDITEHRSLERQYFHAQKMEAVGHLAGGIAHDFNNLLTVVMSSAELIAVAPEDCEKTRQRAALIVKAAEKAANVTDQLLAFSRRQIQRLRVLDVRELVDEFSRMLPEFIPEDVDIAVTHADGRSPVRADQAQLEQVLMNLVVNALDAMPNGGRLEIATRNLTPQESLSVKLGPWALPPCDYVRITVADTGCGMDEITRAHLFEPFFTTKSGKGTGLGLATVYGIVKQSKGWISVESEPGVGSRFDIYLPQASDAEAPTAAPLPAMQPDHATRATILLVEDQAEVRLVLGEYLGSRGHEVLMADGGEAALRIAAERSGTIDVLLTDIIMPQMRGPELAERLASLHPETRVLYMSGYSDFPQDKYDLQNATVLQKPMNLTDLNDSIAAVLSAKWPGGSEDPGTPAIQA